ncbi:hypothetical protein XENORESO_001662 [Xenotaenia resolanae]|uniref:Uncharacterized protein n=1 Tax=Xenotaenia resolanae TaxID=208358 RepID=A0ABV0VUX9_9TELE
MPKNKDDDGCGGGGGEGAGDGGSGGETPGPRWPGPARPGDSVRQGSARGDTHKHKRGREGAAVAAREGGLPTSDPADGGHMAAASQIKRLRLGGSAITAV